MPPLTEESTLPEAPEGVHSEYNPPAIQVGTDVNDALKRFDQAVELANKQPSRAMQALRLAELVLNAMPEEMRNAHAQLKYETYPKKEGGLGLQVDFRRSPKAAMQLHALRQEAERLLRTKRVALSESH